MAATAENPMASSVARITKHMNEGWLKRVNLNASLVFDFRFLERPLGLCSRVCQVLRQKDRCGFC